jgi:hypothetical protein
MAAKSDLCTLADAANWVQASTTGADASVLSRLITSMSGTLMAYLARGFLLPTTISERYDGPGSQRIYVRRWPILSVGSFTINNVTVPPATPPAAGQVWPTNGYLVEPWDGIPPGKMQAIDLYGGGWNYGFSAPVFVPGRENISITYTAGYQVMNEQAVVSSSPPEYQVQAPYGPWGSDQGVVGPGGAAFTAVASSPGPDQYAVGPNDDGVTGLYQFNEANANQTVSINYGYIPAAINDACIEWVGERYRYRKRIGWRSESVGGGQQSTSYDLSAIPAYIKLMLAPYVNVVPVGPT